MKPKTPEKPWLTQGDEKLIAVREMFAEIAPSYDRVNSVMSLSLHHRWRQAAVKAIGIKPGDKVLDLCCGTGDFLSPILKSLENSGEAVGIDFCEPMLRQAEQKFGDRVQLMVADACKLPFAEESFDCVTVGWGLRNVPDLRQALSEAIRVLKPSGRFATLDMARPRGKVVGAVAEKSFHTIVPRLGKLVGHSTAYEYLPKSTERFLSRQALKEEMEAAGFAAITIRDFFFGNICLHTGVKP
ncbi:MAG: bifunctional demethylmenaquinone methyltransferase/2-methoxy-6-polyprenyl-1,4-benzoquinol methylase UbiE [Fimbriimonadaceae bacterium]|nr:bifunctional demethylmenaquinone methyltransferase/2-methoxy-6-polyprenyl-1,4-benzoquinol methylase UbiE [Fimbriimonadaceae bacterium]